MAKHPGWVSAQKAAELLGIDRKTLLQYRDKGVLKLGPHFAAFPETMSRDSYRWNVGAIRKQLQKLEQLQMAVA
jgi:predicted site-specific integrase-resolvase